MGKSELGVECGRKRLKLRRVLPPRAQAQLDLGRYPVDQFVGWVAGQLKAGSLLLDAGAGECAYKPLFAHVRYIGLDFALGAPRWDYGRLDVVGDLLRIPLDSDAFDAVLCTQVLEHIAQPFDFIKELFRVLKPEGKLYLTAPQGGREHQPPHDYFRYTSFGLQKLFGEAGFQIDFIEPEGGYFWYLSNRVSFLHRHLFPKGRQLRYRILFAPLEPLSKLVFRIVLPLLLFHLDFLDQRKKFTLGYRCQCTKPHEGSVPRPRLFAVSSGPAFDSGPVGLER